MENKIEMVKLDSDIKHYIIVAILVALILLVLGSV